MTTTGGNTEPDILLIDDGELDEVVRVLESQGLPFRRLRGGQIPADVAPPCDLLIVTPRRLERIRPGSPAEAAAGRPHRIVAVQEDSPAMRRRLRRAGLHLLVRLPADAQIWRLLISRALYQGHERREDFRVAVGSEVAIGDSADHGSQTILIDLSNRGCRLQTREDFREGDAIEFTLPMDPEAKGKDEMLTLAGQVRRIALRQGSDQRTLAVVFDRDMSTKTRTRLTVLINRWASGPDSLGPTERQMSPAIPACTLPTLPDLTLDDETDPPIRARSHLRVQLRGTPIAQSAEAPANRRARQRGSYESAIVAEGLNGPVVLIGRDLSAGGMRVEKIGNLTLGDRFRIALHRPGQAQPYIVHAKISRDDGDDGFALLFDSVDAETARGLEKLVASLPDVESLEDGELGGLGAILSEILID